MARVKRDVSVKFTDVDGESYDRSSTRDFETLESRNINAVRDITNVDKNPSILDALGKAHNSYTLGHYQEARGYLHTVLELQPRVEPYLFYYLDLCDRVLSIPLRPDEIDYEESWREYQKLSERKRKKSNFQIMLRCKWCGRLTKYINPNTPTYGFSVSENGCSHCGHMYPMPTWMWDSPDGRAYSYYRLSFGSLDDSNGRQFYKDFLEDYNPLPTVDKTGFFSKGPSK